MHTSSHFKPHYPVPKKGVALSQRIISPDPDYVPEPNYAEQWAAERAAKHLPPVTSRSQLKRVTNAGQIQRALRQQRPIKTLRYPATIKLRPHSYEHQGNVYKIGQEFEVSSTWDEGFKKGVLLRIECWGLNWKAPPPTIRRAPLHNYAWLFIRVRGERIKMLQAREGQSVSDEHTKVRWKGKEI